MNSKRTLATSACAALVVVSLAACGSGSSDNSAGSSGSDKALTTVTYWDPYPQYDASSDWAKYVEACAPAGTTLKRTAVPNGDVLKSLTTAVKEGTAPDVVLLDNPAVPDAAASGLLVDAKTAGINTQGPDANLAGPGTGPLSGEVTPAIKVWLAWAVVGIPLAWGVYRTLVSAAKFFH